MTDTENFEGEEQDLVPFDGEPEFKGSGVDGLGEQDDDAFVQYNQFATTGIEEEAGDA